MDIPDLNFRNMGHHANLLVVLIIAVIALSCIHPQPLYAQAGKLNSIELLEKMRPGMHYNEVQAILGKPKRSELVSELWLVRWNLQKIWVGYIPHDFVFNPADSSLLAWGENEEDYQKQQARLKALADALEEATAPPASTGGSGGSDRAVTNDPQLMQQFAGRYYSFSAVGGGQTGGTERRMVLCANGQFRQSSESGYSGNAGQSGAWGTAAQGGSSGTWSIQGTLQNGTLSTTDANGKTTNYNYRSCGDGCYMFGNTKFAYEGTAGC